MNSIGKPVISIIIPVYNVERYLSQCLDSVIKQTYANLEIICVNDGSTDSSLNILEDYAGKDSRIVIIDQLNQGLSGARNSGMKIATGDFIMFLDSDDWVEYNICEVLLERAISLDVDIVECCYIKEFIDHSSISYLWSEEDFTVEIQQIIRRLFGPIDGELRRPQDLDLPVSVWMKLFKADLAKKVDFVDTKKIGTEDLLFQIMVYSECNKYSYINKPLYHYRRSDYGTLTTKYMPEKYERWQNLYNILEEIIRTDYPDSTGYYNALDNRIAFSMIGIGLNEILSEKSLITKSKRLKSILDTDRYRNALDQLELHYLPYHWKVFFVLCKYRMTILLVIMLEMIEFLRKRV